MSEISEVIVHRVYKKKQTESIVEVLKEDGSQNFFLVGLELPHRDNAGTKSYLTSGCISEGIYDAVNNWKSPSQGLCISIPKVPGRQHILIHKCNWAFELLGCLGVGMSHADMPKLDKNKKIVYPKDGAVDNVSSGLALTKLMKALPSKFKIKFTSVTGPISYK